MRAEYLIRLDDACPTMDGSKWSEVEALLQRHGVKPIVAVVPANADPALIRGRGNGRFWEKARGWMDTGWMIALHGYSHTLRPSRAGVVPVNRETEFVDLALDEQKQRIRDGVRCLREQGIEPQAWVAPAHGSDKNTLEALRAESSIHVVSDCFARHPVRRWGFVWIPQQLWRPRSMPGGLWTICLHPNEMTQADMKDVGSFLDAHKGDFPEPREAANRAVPWSAADAAFQMAFVSMIRLRRSLKRRKNR